MLILPGSALRDSAVAAGNADQLIATYRQDVAKARKCHLIGVQGTFADLVRTTQSGRLHQLPAVEFVTARLSAVGEFRPLKFPQKQQFDTRVLRMIARSSSRENSKVGTCFAKTVEVHRCIVIRVTCPGRPDRVPVTEHRLRKRRSDKAKSIG